VEKALFSYHSHRRLPIYRNNLAESDARNPGIRARRKKKEKKRKKGEKRGKKRKLRSQKPKESGIG
jgi:hypothetical protein